MPLTIYTGGAKGVDTHVERLCHLYGHACVVLIPPCHPRAKSLAPLTQSDLEFSHHLLSPVHGVEAMDPKHDFYLHLQGQHVAKRFVLRIDQPSAVHDDSAKHECGLSALFHLIHLFLGPITHSHQDFGSKPKKVYPWGVPPRVSSRVQSPHVMSLHQSAPPVDSLNHVARSVWAHSTLFSAAVQDGELFAVDCAVLRADRHVV